MKIEIIAGSPRSGSLSLRVAKHLFNKFKDESEFDTGLINMHEAVFPFIQKVWTKADEAPEILQPVAKRMFEANGFIICSPEYNGAYSPAMKNLFDHFPKQVKKPFGIVTTSPGAMGGIRASQQLLQLVPALFGIASPTLLIVPEVDKKFDEDGNLVTEVFQKNINDFVNDFIWLARKLKG